MRRHRATIQMVRLFAFGVVALAATCMSLRAQSPTPTTIQAVLAHKLESKSAKVGDAVTAKTVGRAEFNGTSVPEGSMLMGKVTVATRSPAALAFQFNSLVIKHQDAVAVQATVIAIAPAASDVDPNFQVPVRGGYTQAAPINQNHTSPDASANAITGTGSTIKNVSLDEGTLTSGKEIKLASETRLAVSLQPPTK